LFPPFLPLKERSTTGTDWIAERRTELIAIFFWNWSVLSSKQKSAALKYQGEIGERKFASKIVKLDRYKGILQGNFAGENYKELCRPGNFGATYLRKYYAKM